MNNPELSSLSSAVKGPLSSIPDAELTPRVRDVIHQQLDENQLLSSALAKMRERIEELERLVDSDTLTPLPNRRRFVREVERVALHGRRYGPSSSWVMFVDVDGLKQINDTHGHIAGGAALIHVANIRQALVRTTDVVARIGGADQRLQEIDQQLAWGKANGVTEASLTEGEEKRQKLLQLKESVLLLLLMRIHFFKKKNKIN